MARREQKVKEKGDSVGVVPKLGTEEIKSNARCELCGEHMPRGEEMFKYHGHSGPCPEKKDSVESEPKTDTSSVESETPPKVANVKISVSTEKSDLENHPKFSKFKKEGQ